MQKMSGEGYAYGSESSRFVDFQKHGLDAYVSFGNTADAIGDKFKDMIDNKKMIVQSYFLARAVEAKLKSLFLKHQTGLR